jgi:twitching motility protein PilJ
MAKSMQDVSSEAGRSAEVAKSSVDMAHKGSETVRDTIGGMDSIREQIQETSKRLKRLGESSQEIGDIVGLINDIADQTNILALNAAIQASSAGEAGRGFAVVADEVQRLAERSTNATRQIENLVTAIQADTNEAVISMEQTTTEVVEGATRAENAGDALEEIEKISSELAELIAKISKTANQHAEGAVKISSSMTVIEDVTRKTSEGTSETAESIGNLAGMAENLKQQVSGFRLPE